MVGGKAGDEHTEDEGADDDFHKIWFPFGSVLKFEFQRNFLLACFTKTSIVILTHKSSIINHMRNHVDLKLL